MNTQQIIQENSHISPLEAHFENRAENKAISRFYNCCIVIPTYNEKDNIAPLLDKIFAYERKNYGRKDFRAVIHVLVVDDNSPDGTADIVNKYQRKNDRVHLLLRIKKEGLGAAYIAGMKHAMTTLSPDVIFEMDADHSHNPRDIFKMISQINKGNDFVIGSRYVAKGRVPDNWGLHRKIISACAGLVTKIGLGLYGIKDCSGGFRAIRASVLEAVQLDRFSSRGYSFQAELLEGVVYNGFKIKEVPIKFHERKAGKSKMSVKDITEGFALVLRIRMFRLRGMFYRK